jgi:hypothetical protein
MSDYKIELCKKCVNKSFDSSQGIVCGLTKAKPTFQMTCQDFVKDVAEERRLNERAALENASYDHGNQQESSTPVWKIVLNVIIFIVIIVKLIAAFAQ